MPVQSLIVTVQLCKRKACVVGVVKDSYKEI